MNDAAQDKAQDTNPHSGLGSRIDQWRRRAGRVNAEAVAQILENPDSRSVLYMVFQNTRYLSECCLAHPDAVIEALRGEPARVLSEVARDLRALDRATGPASALARAIRPCKERGVVAIALAELSGKWSVGRAGAALADLGERTLDAALSWLTRMAVRHGDIILKDDAAAAPLPGLYVLGGGDLGAGEASYCGPLEISVVYDMEAMEKTGVTVSERTLQRLAETLRDSFRSTRELPAIFELDCDRIDAKAGESQLPLALPAKRISAFLSEPRALRARAWFARARVVAGDRAAGAAFVEQVGSPVWQDGLSGGEIRLAVEPARPGQVVDPIWRLAETCRLALGARLEDVRQCSVRGVFEAAAKIGALDSLTAHRLCGNADFVQAARSRLQMIEGHGRPIELTEESRAQRAVLCGYSKIELFDRVYNGCLAEAEQQWLNIIEPVPVAGDAESPAGLSQSVRLEELGFVHGRQISATVDNWIRGRYGAGDPSRGHRRLSEVAPGLLTEFANTQSPDRAVALFDRVLSHVPPESDPFKFLTAHPAITTALVDLLGNTVGFGEALADSPRLVDEIFAGAPEVPESGAEWLERYLAPRNGKQLDVGFLSEVSHWVRENRARLVYYMLLRAIDPERAGQMSAAIAERAVKLVYETLAADTAAHGGEPGRGLALIALGDFGGRELVPGAPIDLAFVYDPATEQGPNDHAHAFYQKQAAKLAQALTTGSLFDIDTRKRPGGASAEMATDLNVYLNFYQTESHPDEHVELTRARVICGPQGLKDRIEGAIGDAVTRPRKAERLMIDADKGRSKQQRRNKPSSLWDIDRIRGGLGDLCFIAEILQVRFGAEHPYVLAPATADALSALSRAGCLDPDTATDLAETHVFYSRLRMILMLTGTSDLGRERPRQRLQMMLARAAGVSSYGSVEPLIQGHAERVQAHYKRLILGDETAIPAEGIIAA